MKLHRGTMSLKFRSFFAISYKPQTFLNYRKTKDALNIKTMLETNTNFTKC